MTPRTAADGPTVSVVIPSYRRVDRVPPLVAEYLRQGADQVVVVLDGPHPGWEHALGDWLDDARVTVSELAVNGGLALARIEGLANARCDVVICADDDVEPHEGYIDAHRAFHATHRDSVLLGYMPVALPPKRGSDDAPTYLYAREYEMQAQVWRRAESATILQSLWGGTISLPRALYERAEELKPSVRLDYNEDLDLGLRLIELGARASFDERAAASHHHVRHLAGYIKECTDRGTAVAAIESRWNSRPAQLTPVVEIPPEYSRALGRMQRLIAGRDDGGAVQWAAVAAYRAAGAVRLFALQDRVARMLRRALAMRGYRLATAPRDAAASAPRAPQDPHPQDTRPARA